jgi:hypothetical protein
LEAERILRKPTLHDYEDKINQKIEMPKKLHVDAMV